MENDAKHPLDEATCLAGGPDTWQGRTSELYANMIGPFGGIISATLLRAAFCHPECLGEPVALTVNFAAPIRDGEFDIRTKIAKTNRSTQHWIMELSQEGEIAATATMVTAVRRKTWSSTELEFPDVPGADAFEPLPLDFFPNWVKRYDIRPLRGPWPPIFSIGEQEAFVDSIGMLWVRDEPQRRMDFISLTSICDVFFPRIYIRREKYAPASTVSLTTYFHVDGQTLAEHGSREVLGHVRANRFHDNFFDHTAEVWTPGGELLATTNQMVYYKE